MSEPERKIPSRDGQFGAQAGRYEERGAQASRGPRVLPAGNAGRGGAQPPRTDPPPQPPAPRARAE